MNMMTVIHNDSCLTNIVTYCDDRSHLHKIRMNPRFILIIFFKTCVGEDRGGGHCQGGERKMVFIQLNKYFPYLYLWFNATFVQNIVPDIFDFLFTIQSFHLYLFGGISLQQDFLAVPEAQIRQRTLADSEKCQQCTIICPQCSNDSSMDSHKPTIHI